MIETLLGVSVILGLVIICYVTGIVIQIALGRGDDLNTGPEVAFFGAVVVILLALLVGFGKVLGMMLMAKW